MTHASNTLRTLGCYFYPAVQELFHKRALTLYTNQLDYALEVFQTELQR